AFDGISDAIARDHDTLSREDVVKANAAVVRCRSLVVATGLLDRIARDDDEGSRRTDRRGPDGYTRASNGLDRVAYDTVTTPTAIAFSGGNQVTASRA